MDTILRVVVAYAFVLIALRLMGKREFGQLSPAELVTLLLIPELLSNPVQQGDASMVRALVGISTIMLLVFGTSLATHMNKTVETAVDGKPTLLVAHGEFIAENLNKERVTPGEVFSEMHKAGLDDLPQVRWAVLETDGKISIVPEPPTGTGEQNPSGGPVGG
ncbi:MAG: YetF domain-containing protein [Chloroflexota bacterium]|mgnify:CR=1 FL=1|nr:DUF421 domain-containing protein [Anaerolineae bacterium]HMM27978.1 DUF421 domain-containing protein [Aggregatilineaceae bacterium]